MRSCARWSELVEELERSHRRLIETNVQLVSLREVAELVSRPRVDAAETTRLVTRYLRRRSASTRSACCSSTASAACSPVRGAGAASWHPLEVSLADGAAPIVRTLWLDRDVQHLDCRPGIPPACLPEGHPLARRVRGAVAGLRACRWSPPGPDAATRRTRTARAAPWPHMLAPPPGGRCRRLARRREDARAIALAVAHLPLARRAGRRARAEPPRSPPPSDHARRVVALRARAHGGEHAALPGAVAQSQRCPPHVLDACPARLVAVEPAGRHAELQPHAGEDLLGLSEEADVLGMPVGELFGEDADELIARHARLGAAGACGARSILRSPAGDAAARCASPRRACATRAARVYGAIATFVDLTPIRAPRSSARQLDRLAALGRFTSSVAHEIRNPLTGIGMGVQQLSRALVGQRRARARERRVRPRRDPAARPHRPGPVRRHAPAPARPHAARRSRSTLEARRAARVEAMLEARDVALVHEFAAGAARGAARRRPDAAGVHQPVQERRRGLARRQQSRCARSAAGAAAAHARRRRARHRRRPGSRHGRRHAPHAVRTLLHDQAGRHRPRASTSPTRSSNGTAATSPCRATPAAAPRFAWSCRWSPKRESPAIDEQGQYPGRGRPGLHPPLRRSRRSRRTGTRRRGVAPSARRAPRSNATCPTWRSSTSSSPTAAGSSCCARSSASSRRCRSC